MGIREKHRRHIERLAWQYGWYEPVRISHHQYQTLCSDFIRVEWAFNAIKRPSDSRKVFMNYPFVYDQICARHNFHDIRVMPQLKSYRSFRRHAMYWKRVCHRLKWEKPDFTHAISIRTPRKRKKHTLQYNSKRIKQIT